MAERRTAQELQNLNRRDDMEKWKHWIREDLGSLGGAMALLGGLIYGILFWFGYNLTYYNTILPEGNFWKLAAQILVTGAAGAALLALLFRLLSGRGDC